MEVSEDVRKIIANAVIDRRKKYTFVTVDESNKRLNTELFNLLQSFGGFHTRIDNIKTWQFTYNPVDCLSRACAHGYIYGVKENTAFIPTPIKSSMMSHVHRKPNDVITTFYGQENLFGYGTSNEVQTNCIIVRPPLHDKECRRILDYAGKWLLPKGKLIMISTLTRGDTMAYSSPFDIFNILSIESTSWHESPYNVIKANLIVAMK